jgi:hypothetical protein
MYGVDLGLLEHRLDVRCRQRVSICGGLKKSTGFCEYTVCLCCRDISQHGISAIHPGEIEVDIVGIA